MPLALTPGEHYLRHWRAIGETVPISPRLRWHWGLFALVGFITHCITDQPMGVRITPLSRTTNQRDGNRLVYGQAGGGVIRLVDGPDPLVLGEGVETTLSGYDDHTGRLSMVRNLVREPGPDPSASRHPRHRPADRPRPRRRDRLPMGLSPPQGGRSRVGASVRTGLASPQRF